MAARQFADRVPITFVRPPMVLGEWDHQGVTLFQTVDRVGIHLVPGWTNHRYSLIHADDLVRALILAGQRGSRLAPAGCTDALYVNRATGSFWYWDNGALKWFPLIV